MTVTVRYCIDGHRKFVDFPMNSMVIFHSYVSLPEGMGHGQYLVHSSKSSLFEECILVFQLLVYKRILLSLLT